MTNNLYTLVLSALAVVGLIVLVALHDVAGNVAVPVIVGLVGVHTGAAISSPTVVPSPPDTPPGGSAAATGGQIEVTP